MSNAGTMRIPWASKSSGESGVTSSKNVSPHSVKSRL